MEEMYIPTPVDTSDVDLPDYLIELSERISKNTHDVWAQSRISQGWTYGEKRDDIMKQHPGLVPYELLSDEEANYDRSTSIQVIKYILSMGFTIVSKTT